MSASADQTAQWALRYARELDWPVFPVNRRTKRPYFENMLELATTDAEQIEQWWLREYRGAGIAVACGRAGIFVVDPDAGVGREMSLPALVDDHGDAFLDTVSQETGGHGLQLVYGMPEPPLRNFQGTKPGSEDPGPLGYGIDGRGGGGYAILPPSLHPNGTRYEWLAGRSPWEVDLAPMPEWLSRLIRGKQWVREGRARTLADVIIDRARAAVAKGGGRNDAGFWAALQLRDNGYSQEQSLALLVEKYLPGLRSTDTHGRVERYDERAVRASVESAFQREARAPWGAGAGDSGASEKRSSSQANGAADERILKFVTARCFAEAVGERVPWMLEGYLASGAITEIGGKVKRAGKTTLVLAMCAAVVRGERFLDRETTQGPVVYLTEQAGPSFREALRRASLLERDDFFVLPWKDTLV